MVEVYFSQLMKEDKFKEFSKETTVLYGILRNNPLPDKKEMRRDFHEKSTH
jgi:hypothetical protein